ncbi:NADP-dependent oxidoreductase [Sphingomonas psychrolutea]|uniref:NADP-dependent oxidoreductase n=1 Tax=Sphingomonas psychrolutea TaxID=1259676 RepID=A0ABQ1GWE6_9SPHN|nr:NADP-dependent oxidoreductase [Sphingomonas psychrolutea]GGA51611.1 NADP-dependent oxidoreductase [Sphingomonas psychrolutea]
MNRQVVLVSRPTGVAQADNFAIRESNDPVPGDGQILVHNRFLSVEPAMRGWIADVGNYTAPVGIGEVMRSLAVGRIVASRHPNYAVGEHVAGWFGWQEFAAVDSDAIVRRVTETDLPLSLALGVLGINGVTAHLALTLIGEPKPGDTVLVSTAAGSVGSAVGQIATILGARAVGIAGGADKVRQCVEDFGYAAAIDYKAPELGHAIDAACPNGVDVYFDNTAGVISDTVYPRLTIGARVVICGTASIPAWDPWPTGPRIERHLLVKRARAQGFVIFDHNDRYDASVAQLAAWVREGRLRYAEDVLDGIEACPDALAGLYRGENRGKRVIELR